MSPGRLVRAWPASGPLRSHAKNQHVASVTIGHFCQPMCGGHGPFEIKAAGRRVQTVVVEVGDHVTQRHWAHREHRVGQTCCHGLEQDVPKAHRDALQRRYAWFRGELRVEVRVQLRHLPVLNARHGAVRVRGVVNPANGPSHRLVVRVETGEEVAAGDACYIDSLRATRSPCPQSTARKGLSVCLRWERGPVRVCCGPSTTTCLGRHVDSVRRLSPTLLKRQARVLVGWVRMRRLWK